MGVTKVTTKITTEAQVFVDAYQVHSFTSSDTNLFKNHFTIPNWFPNTHFKSKLRESKTLVFVEGSQSFFQLFNKKNYMQPASPPPTFNFNIIS